MLKQIGDAVGTVRDYGVSFAIGAVPAFLGTAFLATAFALSSGIATAIGLPSGLAVVAGVIGTALTASTTVGLGAVFGVAGLFGGAALLDAVPGLRNAQMKGAGIGLGVVSGVAASVAMAFSLAASDDKPDVSSMAVPVSSHVAEAQSIITPDFLLAANGNEKPGIAPSPVVNSPALTL